MDEYMDEDLRLAIKLSEEIEFSSRNNSVQIQGNVLAEDEDEDLLAIKLSEEIELQHSRQGTPSKQNLEDTRPTNDEDEDFQWAIKLSEEIESQHSHQSTPTKQNSKDTQPKNDEDEDFQWAIGLSQEIESRHSNQNTLAEQNGYREIPKNDDLLSVKSFEKNETSQQNQTAQSDLTDVECDTDEDLLMAIKLSKEIESQALLKKISRDNDFKYALKLSEQLNGDKSVINSEPKTTDDDADYLFAIQIANASSDIEIIDDDLDEVDDDRNVRVTATKPANYSSSRSYETDYLLAVQLSVDSASEKIDDYDNYNQTVESTSIISVSTSSNKSRKSIDKHKYMDKTLSIVDPSWETIDPTPDIHALFIAFNKRFFWGRLDMVEVKWSPRMTSCAGICSYRSKAGHCIVSLSKPLLQLRPRKDLVETLLHEMIHAYLFVTKNNRDRDGHGPQFHEHMYRINRESGTRITVYHSFHDEVKSYKVHWWQCDGPCQRSPPYYGMVKRAMNRAPGPYDQWWSDHLAVCGGTYHKIKEPENFTKKKTEKGKKVEPDKSGKTTNIADFLNRPKNSSQLGSSASSSTGKPSATVDSGRLINAGNVSRYDPPSMSSTANWSSQTAATATKPASTFGSNKIITLTDLSKKLNQRSPNKSSPKKWVPLPGQRNILQFMNKS